MISLTLKIGQPKSVVTKKVSEYDQEIPQSQTADNLMTPRGRALNHQETLERQIKQSNQLSLVANIAAVEGLIKRDTRLKVKNIAQSVDISSGSADKNFTQQLKLRKVCAWFAPPPQSLD